MAPEIIFPNLGIKINELNNVAINLFGLNVYWYGLIIASAITIGILCVDHTLKKEGKSLDDIINFILIVLITSVLGARIYYVAFSWDYYKDHLGQILNFRAGGIAIYGAVIASILTAIIYCKVKKINFFWLADLFAPYLLLGQCMGRWGNFFNKEAFGSSTNSLFAMAIRCDAVKNIPNALMDQFIQIGEANYIQVHPTFLYESVGSFIIFLILLIIYKHKKYDGDVFAFYLMGYSFVRFFVEGLRTDSLYCGPFRVSQLVAIGLFLIGLVIFFASRIKHRDKRKYKNVY